MKKLTLILFLGISISGFCQVDTLIKMNGEQLLINVIEIAESTIKFSYQGESFSNSIPKGTVKEIRFKSGRVQDFSSELNVAGIKSCLDWEKVQISKIDSEVEGLQKIDIVGAKAKGMTTMSSIGKLQDRAFDKIKIETAMLGGNVAYIMSQNIEEAVSGGSNGYGGSAGSTKMPSVTISGLAYTTKKVFKNDISFGDYTITNIYVLKTNKFTFDDHNFSPQTIRIEEGKISEENGFQKLNISISAISKLAEYTLIYADDQEVVLSGIYSKKSGKTTYYNVILKKS